MESGFQMLMSLYMSKLVSAMPINTISWCNNLEQNNLQTATYVTASIAIWSWPAVTQILHNPNKYPQICSQAYMILLMLLYIHAVLSIPIISPFTHTRTGAHTHAHTHTPLGVYCRSIYFAVCIKATTFISYADTCYWDPNSWFGNTNARWSGDILHHHRLNYSYGTYHTSYHVMEFNVPLPKSFIIRRDSCLWGIYI